eukprot:TRINITY_DN831_c0_g1_i1.p1 TRINITY_DN831_c0_g1~~TRINITY_DN831_c0_g1_i1.p1  ORF type:complete len:304 (+),score=64.77 TRINITY_DN831_c0_g1_i1:82-912(+)
MKDDQSTTIVNNVQKRRKVNKNKEIEDTTVEASDEVGLKYESDRTLTPHDASDQRATATNTVDAPSKSELQNQTNTKNNPDDSKDPAPEGIYKGMKGYTKYIETKPQPKGMRAGPIRASENIRLTCRFDFQPDVCKDWKETGFCGYGMSCKFMHDRGDYKSGWEIEREYEAKLKAQREGIAISESSDSESDSDSGFPWACHICRKDFTRPIVTNCGHYFCEACALNHYRKDPKCYICGNSTSGVFNRAKKLEAKLEERKKNGKVAPPASSSSEESD